MVRRGQSVQGSASCNSEKQKIPNAKRSRGELDPEAGPQTATVHPERTRYWASIDRVDSLPIRRISEAVTFKILILWRISLSSRQPYRRCHCQNCNDNGHKLLDENETCQSLPLEPVNVEILARGHNRCLHVVEIPHPSIHIQSPKLDSPRTQL
ncbi:unnamed protein product [Hymenolepis diminuta]|uniref:Uncharacterized protein n=1 Tax=Hymenolepis diminuta TaxID=6216 RepID=A0A0R3SEY1_HYMDI|nr:unnamed protein product [Hymenolepis diminuta]